MTGGVDGGIHISDYTNASRTLCLNLHTLDWEPQLLDFFELPASALPRLVSNSEVYGHFKKGKIRRALCLYMSSRTELTYHLLGHMLEGIPISGLAGDQQSALIGNKCLTRGMAKQTYGSFLVFFASKFYVVDANLLCLLSGTGCFM